MKVNEQLLKYLSKIIILSSLLRLAAAGANSIQSLPTFFQRFLVQRIMDPVTLSLIGY
jgi:hypothetical protein